MEINRDLPEGTGTLPFFSCSFLQPPLEDKAKPLPALDPGGGSYRELL